MDRVILRYLSGSRAGEVQEIPLDQAQDLAIGRDHQTHIRFDPERDDLVGRQHARITRDATDRLRFFITDLNSRNGTYVNRQRVVGTVALNPGDVLQFGPNGPELRFDLDPLPSHLLKTTRMVDATTAPPPAASTAAASTRDVQSAGSAAAAPAATPVAGAARAPIGRETVERLVSTARLEGRRSARWSFVAAAVVIALVAAGLVWRAGRLGDVVSQQVARLDAAEAGRPLTPTEIAEAYTQSTALIEMGWKLVHTQSGGQLYHEYFVQTNAKGKPEKDEDGRQKPARPVYLRLSDGTIEPALTLSRGEFLQNQPIGFQASGSSFVVTNDGFMLTNRHVVAPWETKYTFPRIPGLLIDVQNGKVLGVLEQPPNDWVPTAARILGRRPIMGKLVEGRLDYLDVTFAKNKLRLPAKLARISDRHDAAMIKVDVPHAVKKVELYDNFDHITPGSTVTVMGYPGISPNVAVATRSLDVFNRETQMHVVPDPTITPGNVGRILRGVMKPESGREDDYFSEFGEAYQLTVNATGSGNSGGPIFDERARVIGIFTASRSSGGATMTFAVPIRYGMELMSLAPVLK